MHGRALSPFPATSPRGAARAQMAPTHPAQQPGGTEIPAEEPPAEAVSGPGPREPRPRSAEGARAGGVRGCGARQGRGWS